MDNWNKIISSHVVKMFSTVAHEFWGLDVHFYDKSGNYKNSGIPFRNHICALMQTKKKTAKDCLSFRIENLKALNLPYKTFDCKCCGNLRIIVVSIIVKGDCVGYMVCSGMQFSGSNSLREQSIRKLTRLGFDKAEAERCYDNVGMANSRTENYVLKFMKLIAKDVSAFCKTLLEEAEIKKEQTLLIDWKLNGKYKTIIGKSIPMEKIICKLGLIENSDSPVLIEGETGTGKELIAAAIHYNSIRKDKVFVMLNCSAFSDEILNSELFGHEKGSFTGAISEKKGLFEIADGGTLFLDEIGDISVKMQGKLLRVLENGTFYRVGGTVQKEIDVRIITATNKDLTTQVEEGLFRKDFLYRINALRISVPPLRNRREDILPLFFHFLEHSSNMKNIEKKDVSPSLIELLVNHNWPGNVRELKNVVESLITMSGESKRLESEHFPIEVTRVDYNGLSAGDHEGGERLHDVLDTIEKEITIKSLESAKWNKTATARELGISRASLNRRIEKFNIHNGIILDN